MNRPDATGPRGEGIDPRSALPWLFLVTGASGLIYQVLWMRVLGQALGTHAQASTVTLAAFMGGLGIGAAVASRFVDRVRAPLRMYGVLELALCAIAWILPDALRALVRLPDGVALGLAAVGIALPAAIMGASYPLMCVASERFGPSTRPARSGASLLYAVNTLGAMAGALAAAYLVLPRLGIEAGNRRVAIVMSLAAAVAALILSVFSRESARFERRIARAASQPAPVAAAIDGAFTQSRGFLWAALLAGFAALSIEALFTRVLSMVLGGTVFAFATMLAWFLFGIAGGSLLAGSWLRARPRTAGRWAAGALVLAAVFTLMAGYLAPELPYHYLKAHRRLGGGPWVDIAVAGPVLLGPALMSGFAFAALLRAFGAESQGRQAGRVYAWNTLGSVLGAVATGYVTIPWLGLAGALGVAVTALLLAAGFALRRRRAVLLAAA
ncbi:MAG: spermidine synthase family protein, partial [Planctomycetota bacterium]